MIKGAGMSLSKQLLLLISFIFFLIFSGNYIISINNIRAYLQEEAMIHVQDTATSLGLSITPYIQQGGIDPMAETMIAAIFDRGYYHEITLSTVSGEELIRLTNPKRFDLVPEWFVKFLPMETATAESQLNAGWQIWGTIAVTSSPGYGYLKLYEQAQKALYYSLAAFAVSLVLLILFLRLILQPLKAIETLSNRIASGKFETITKLPWTTEIKNVAISMNSMSGKIKHVIDRLNASLQEMNARILVDRLTGLPLKQVFESDLKKMLLKKEEGYVLLVKIEALGEIAKTRDSSAVDTLLKDLAKGLTGVAQAFSGERISAYHFYGSEFAVVAASVGMETMEKIAEAISAFLDTLSEKHGMKELAFVGGVRIEKSSTIPSLVAAASESCIEAKRVGANRYVIKESTESAKDTAAWHKLVGEIIEAGRFDIGFVEQTYGIDDDSRTQPMMEEVYTRVYDREGAAISIGAFISMVEELNLASRFDLDVTRRVIAAIEEKGIDHRLIINLSPESIRDEGFKKELGIILKQNKAVASRLVFSLSAYGAAKYIDDFSRFIEWTHRVGTSIILKRFDAHVISLEQVKGLNLDYIRLSRNYTESIAGDGAKQKLVAAIQELGRLLDIRVFAEDIGNSGDLQAIRSIGLAGASFKQESSV